MDTITPNWTSLPEHLLEFIAKRLHTRIDILRFRAVCQSFRSSIALPPTTIFPHFPPIRLWESTIYAIEPLHKVHDTDKTTQTFLVRVDESEPKVQFKDPLSGDPFENVSEKLLKSLNLLDYRVREISKVYKVQAEDNVDFIKVVVSTCDDGFAVMALNSKGQVCVMRRGDEKWTNIDIGPRPSDMVDWIDGADIVFHNDKFYALGSSGRMVSVDCMSFKINEVASPLWFDDGLKINAKIVKSSSDLYLIDKYEHRESFEYSQYEYEDSDDEYHEDNDNDGEYRSHCLNIFKLDEKKCQWVQVKVINELEDKSFFVGVDCSFSLSSKDFSGCKGSCVYFIDYDVVFKEYTAYLRVGVFDLKEGTIWPLGLREDYAKIFYPLPNWMKQNSSC